MQRECRRQSCAQARRGLHQQTWSAAVDRLHTAPRSVASAFAAASSAANCLPRSVLTSVSLVVLLLNSISHSRLVAVV